MNLDVRISLFTDPIRPRKLMNRLGFKTHTTERRPTVMKLGALPPGLGVGGDVRRKPRGYTSDQ
jgi:hypothetical protein